MRENCAEAVMWTVVALMLLAMTPLPGAVICPLLGKQWEGYSCRQPSATAKEK